MDIYQLLTFQSYICVHVYELDFNVLTDLDIQYQHLSTVRNKHSNKSCKVIFVFIPTTFPQNTTNNDVGTFVNMVLFVLCLGVEFLCLFVPYVRFHILVRIR